MLVLQDAAICVNDSCAARYDATASGWDGSCDDCVARTADHHAGLHTTVQLECPYCQ